MATHRSAADDVAIAVFARAPVAGACKTRLIPALGPERAADLQQRMIERTVGCACRAATGPVSLWCAPDATHPAFQHQARARGVALHAQPEGDLGARMLAAFCAQPPGQPLLLIGTDCPVLTPQNLRTCAERLRAGDDAVFLPTEDGGYGLVGLRAPQPALFEAMPWSTAQVMAQTRRRLQAGGLRWSEPALLWDVDTPADLARLQASGLMPVSPSPAGDP